MQRLFILTVLISTFVVSTALAQQPKTRFFTDKTGKFRIRALVVNLNATHVKLRKADGSEVSLPIASYPNWTRNT